MKNFVPRIINIFYKYFEKYPLNKLLNKLPYLCELNFENIQIRIKEKKKAA